MPPAITDYVPLTRTANSVHRQMRWVLLALIPAIVTAGWLFGISIFISLILTSFTAIGVEAGMLRLRNRSISSTLADGSALVTAWLISLSTLPILPWWTLVAITAFALLIKHLYGGLGQNPFNPAMAALCFLLIAFPTQANRWHLMLAKPTAPQQLSLIFGSGAEEAARLNNPASSSSLDTMNPDVHVLAIDAIASATPLTLLKPPQLTEATQPLVQPFYLHQLLIHHATLPLSLAFLFGGLILLNRKIISWQLPVAFLTTIAGVSFLFWLANPSLYAPPYFHLLTGGSVIGAFFILTDPVSGPTTVRAQWLFAIGAGLLVCLIRAFGPYPDGVAFSVLLMNLTAPLLDRLTQPIPFGSDE